MNSPINSLDISSSDKDATIYRTGALNYTYVCNHCHGFQVTNVSDILDHIEAHFHHEYPNIDKEHCTADDENVPHNIDEEVPVAESDELQKSIDHQHSSDLSDLRFKCKLCDENYESLADLNHHLTEHRCKFCPVVHFTREKLLGHLIETHLNTAKLVCSICSANFVCKTEFYRHLQDHNRNSIGSITTIISDIISKCENLDEICVELEVEECGAGWLQCDICGSEFDTKGKLSQHMRNVHIPKQIAVKRGVYMCVQCNRNVQGKFLFYAHQYDHLMGDGKRLMDDVDEASLMDKLKAFLNDNISYDELAPEKAFGCKICCHLSVKRRKNIQTHILQEHVYRLKGKKRTEKRFPCDFCGQKFTLSHNLVVHKRIHTQERPYVCLICNKSFSHSSYMKYHEKVHTGICTHQCATCGMSFKSKTKLNQHNKIHSSEIAKCPTCSKEFKAHRLNVHIKHVHQNEHRPYKCAVCLQAFKTAKTLKTHSYRHTGEKKYKCRFHCDERFTSTAGRRGHERSKHETH